MTGIKKGIQIIKDYLNREDIEAREKSFMLLAGIALIGMLIAFIGGLLIGENIESLLFLGGGFVLFVVLVRIGVKTGKVIVISYIVAAVLILVFMPVNFFTSGGIHGGAAIWNVFDAMYIALVLRGKPRAVLLSLQAVIVVAMYHIYLLYPEVVN